MIALSEGQAMPTAVVASGTRGMVVHIHHQVQIDYMFADVAVVETWIR